MLRKILTIVVPVYNVEDYLESCLNSIYKEITEEIEVIIIDDGSTDKSEEIYHKYIDINNIKIIKQSNKGVSYTRNLGIEKATGRYIMFVDSDDYMKAGWREEILTTLNKSEDEECIMFSKNFSSKTYQKEILLKLCLGISNEKIKDCQIMAPASKIYYLDFLKKNSIKFLEGIINGEDMLFNFEIIVKAVRIKTIKKGIYIYRKNVKSATNRFNPQIITSEKLFHKKLKEIISENINNKEWTQEQKYIMLNGIFICFLSYALDKNSKSIEQLIDLVENTKEYKDVIYDNSIKFSRLSFYRRIFLMCIRNKKYKLAIFIIKNRVIIKEIFYKIKGEYIEKEI